MGKTMCQEIKTESRFWSNLLHPPCMGWEWLLHPENYNQTMEKTFSSKMFAPIYQWTQQYNWEDVKFNTNHCGNLKSHNSHLKAAELLQHITDLSKYFHTYMLNIFNIKTLFKTNMNEGTNTSKGVCIGLQQYTFIHFVCIVFAI
jgi:hypothetical protein